MKNQKYIALLVFTCCLLVYKVRAQDITRLGYKQIDVIRVENIKSEAEVYSLGIDQKTVVREYIDGFGRAVQSVTQQGSPLKKDVVQPVSYDRFGGTPVSYLPYVSGTTDASYQSGMTAQSAFYANGSADKIADDSRPYARAEYEQSPLQRILQSGDIGEGFQTGQHFKSIHYRTNTAEDNVRLWNQDGSSTSTYSLSSLKVTAYTDENGYKTIVFEDRAGHLILKREQADETISGVLQGYLDTYYIYTHAGNIKYMIPPKAVAQMKASGSWVLTSAMADQLAYSYVYDDLGRVVEKKVPGSAVIYIIYDSLHRPLLVQDGNLRATNKWYYTKSDSRKRLMSSGVYTNTVYTTRLAMQAYINTLDFSTSYYEERLTGTAYGYSNQAFPISGTEPLMYYYYDNYDLNNDGNADYSYQSQSLSGESLPVSQVRGYLTAVRKKVVGTSTWLTSVNFYDKRGQKIQVLSNNLLNSSLNDSKTMVTDFSGKVLKAKTVKKTSSATTSVLSVFDYDHMDRVKSIDDSYNGAAAIRIASYTYNELGQLVKKDLHGLNSPATSYLQSVDYRYNIRGQMTSINNSTLSVDDKNGDTNDVFGMELLYEQTDAVIGNTGNFNGQLSAVKWQLKTTAGGSGKQRSYRFEYDKLVRLKNALYKERTGSGNWTNSGAFDEKNISYDENGNILTLQRNAYVGGSITSMDNLQYSYEGNRLSNVTDGVSAALGFKNLTGSTAAYAYNSSGSLVTDPKKGLSITYNILNKPSRITISTSTGRYINYTYDAAGMLLRKQQYDNNVLQKTTDYIDGFVYEDNVLSYFGMAEGRVRNSGTVLKPEYIITDYQGNARVSFEEQNGQAVVRQENSYYPFGLVMPGGLVPTQPNRNLYNGGSEWQNDFADLPDYYGTFYRNYDAALGRFIAIDPLAEENGSITPYHYAVNNPIGFNDPMGDKEVPLKSGLSDLWNSAYGGTWTSGGGGGGGDGAVSFFNSYLDSFAFMDTYLTQGNYWGNTTAGNFNRGYSNFISNKAAGDAEGLALRAADIKETKTNKDWLIERQKEAWNVSSSDGSVGQPGFGESLILVWGSGRAAVDHFQNGNYWRGAGYTALAISDVFLVKALATVVAKGTVTLAAKYVVRQAVASPSLTRNEILALGNPRVTALMKGKGIDRAFREFAEKNFILNPAQKIGLIKFSPMNKGADMVGKGLLKGTWWDVTTIGSWDAHVTKYGSGGIGLFY